METIMLVGAVIIVGLIVLSITATCMSKPAQVQYARGQDAHAHGRKGAYNRTA